MTRGQGKTEGYHERHIIIPPKAAGLFRSQPAGVVAIARKRVDALGGLRRALSFSLRALSQGGPEKVVDKDTTNKVVSPWLRRLESESERDFFEDLWKEVEADDSTPPWFAWLKKQRKRGRDLLEEASNSLPHPLLRRYRAKVKAENAFIGTLYMNEHFKSLRSFEIWEKQNAADRSNAAAD